MTDAERGCIAQEQRIEQMIRRLHHYGDPPDTRLQEDVDSDVDAIMDEVVEYAAERVAAALDEGSAAPATRQANVPNERRLQQMEQDIEVTIRSIAGGHVAGDWKDQAIDELLEKIAEYGCTSRTDGCTCCATPTLRAPEVTGAENYVTPAEVTQGCRTYCDIFEPSGPFQNEHNRRVRRAKGNRGDAIRAVLQEFLKGRTTPKSTPTGWRTCVHCDRGPRNHDEEGRCGGRSTTYTPSTTPAGRQDGSE